MIANPRQVEIEDVAKLERGLLLLLAHGLEIHIVLAGDVGAASVVFPIDAPVDGDVLFLGDHGLGPAHGRLFELLGRMQIIVGDPPGLGNDVLVVNLAALDDLDHIGQRQPHLLFHFLEEHRRKPSVELGRYLQQELATLPLRCDSTSRRRDRNAVCRGR